MNTNQEQRSAIVVDERIQVLKTIGILVGAAFLLGTAAVLIGELVDGPRVGWLRDGFDRPTIEFVVDNRTPWMTTVMRRPHCSAAHL